MSCQRRPCSSSAVCTSASGSSASRRVVGMDAAPPDGDRPDAGRLRGPDVERGVTDVHGLAGIRFEAPERLEQGIRVGLVALGVLGADHDVHRLAQHGEAIESEPDRQLPLRGHDAERPAFVAQDAGGARACRRTTRGSRGAARCGRDRPRRARRRGRGRGRASGRSGLARRSRPVRPPRPPPGRARSATHASSRRG